LSTSRREKTHHSRSLNNTNYRHTDNYKAATTGQFSKLNFGLLKNLCNLRCRWNLISITSYFTPCLPQLAACERHTPSSLAAVIGLSNNDVNALRALRSVRCVRCVRCVGWKPRFTLVISKTRGRYTSPKTASLFLSHPVHNSTEPTQIRTVVSHKVLHGLHINDVALVAPEYLCSSGHLIVKIVRESFNVFVRGIARYIVDVRIERDVVRRPVACNERRKKLLIIFNSPTNGRQYKKTTQKKEKRR